MELELVDLLRKMLPKAGGDLLIGPGDDAAVLAWRDRSDCVVTTDMLMDGVDFRLSEADPKRIGRKCLAVNVSDLAAMGAKPAAAVVSLALPRAASPTVTVQLYAGMLALAAEFGVQIVGGDTNIWDGPLVVNVTAFGKTTPRGPLLRSGARPGDAIVVTGEFGGSILGKHFDFTPRVREALLLAERYEVRAAMDVSDGLSLDLWRMCRESECGAVLDRDKIPLAPAAQQLTASDPSAGTALEHALSDGEDFELLMAMPLEHALRAAAEPVFETKLTIIGEFTAEHGLFSRAAGGARTPLKPRGYEHGVASFRVMERHG